MGKKGLLNDTERTLKRTAKSAQSSVNRANDVIKRVVDGRVRRRRK